MLRRTDSGSTMDTVVAAQAEAPRRRGTKFKLTCRQICELSVAKGSLDGKQGSGASPLDHPQTPESLTASWTATRERQLDFRLSRYERGEHEPDHETLSVLSEAWACHRFTSMAVRMCWPKSFFFWPDCPQSVTSGASISSRSTWIRTRPSAVWLVVPFRRRVAVSLLSEKRVLLHKNRHSLF